MLVFLLSLTTITAALTTTIISLNTSSNVSALTYQDNVDLKFTFNPSITISVSDLTIPSLGPGSSSDSNIATVSVSSNARAGYTLSSTVGSTESTSTYYNYGTDLRISSTDSTNIFTNLGNTTATTLNDIANSKWGYSYISCLDASCNTTTGNWKSGNINVVNGTTDGYGGYANTSTSITHISTNTPGDSAIQYKIGAKASTTQASGTYTNVINFIGVANPVITEYTLSYASNVQDTTNLPSNTTGTTTDGTFNISKTIPTLSDTTRIFKGWCTINNTGHTSSCTDGTNTGSIIQSGGLYTIGSDASTFTGTVYAVWTSNTPTTIAELTYMQDFAALTLGESGIILNNMAEEETATLMDSRDNQVYTVAKLKDGGLWMTKNLAIGCNGNYETYGDSIEQITLTSDDSNVNDLWNTPTILLSTASSNSRASDYTTTRMQCNETYGGYYNYAAATAGTITLTQYTPESTYDICPKGWYLPSSSDISGITGTTTAFSPVYSGKYYDGGFNFAGSKGFWWTSTATSDTNRYEIFYENGRLSGTSDARFIGASVRCRLRGPSIENVTYMQDFADPSFSDRASILNSMTEGIKYTLKDSRDEQEYAVAKLKDGNLWMLDNLNLDIADDDIKAAMYDSSDTKTNASYTQLGYLFNGGGSSPNTNYGVSSAWTSDAQNYYDRPMIDTSNKDVLVTSYGAAAINGKAKVGIYYNFCAASAGTYCYSDSNSSGDATADVCPKGWNLPTINQFQTLYSTTPNYADFRNALSTPLSGYFYSGSATGQNSYSDFWSSTHQSNTYMYYLGVSPSSVNTQAYGYRDNGFVIRCVNSK